MNVVSLQFMGKVRAPFAIQYYLVGILFLIFDLEIAVFYPLAVTLYQVNYLWFLSGNAILNPSNRWIRIRVRKRLCTLQITDHLSLEQLLNDLDQVINVLSHPLLLKINIEVH